jgi:TonB family protein
LRTVTSLIVLASVALAQDRPDARDLLAQGDDPIFTAKTVRLAATKSHGFAGNRPLPGNPFRIEFVRGGKGRAEYLGSPNPITLIIFDGTTLWEYHRLGNQYTKTPTSAWTFEGEIATLDYGRKPTNILSATYQSDESVDFRGRRVDCYVVLAKYNRSPEPLMGLDVMRRVWISKDSRLILRDYWEGGDVGDVRRTVTTDYTDIETDIPLPDELFVFQPPVGSKVAAPVVLGGIIGSIPPPRGTLQKRIAAEYAADARVAGLQGSVILNIEIAPDGHTQNIRILHSLGLGLDEKAIEAVKQWQYDSAASSNAPLLRRVVEVPFRLKPVAPWVLDGSIFNPRQSGSHGIETKPQLRQYAPPDSAACTPQGYVDVSFDIDSDGVPAGVRVTSDTAADPRDRVIEAVRSWRFRPATREGSNIPGTARVILECHPAETPAVPAQIYSVGVVTPPSLLFKFEPEYSEEARRAKVQGDVNLSIVIEPDGKVSGVRVTKPVGSGLDEQAIGTVMQWRFKPGTKEGKPVRVASQVTVSFRLL